MGSRILNLARQVCDVQDGAGVEGSGPLQAIFQFVDIARPIISQQQLHGFRADGSPDSGGAGNAVKKMIGQQPNIFSALTQGWQAQADDIQAEIQIAAETALMNGYFQITAGSRDDPHVNGYGPGAAHRTDLFFLHGS